MLIPQNDASLSGRPKANRFPLATKTTTARQNASAAGRWVMPALSANTGITLAIPVEEPVTSPRHAKANHKRLTRWKKQPSQVSSHDSVDPFWTSLYNLGSGSNGIEVPVKLNGTPLFMELDTGAGVSFISSETYTRHFKDTPPVHPTLACTLTQDTQ